MLSIWAHSVCMGLSEGGTSTGTVGSFIKNKKNPLFLLITSATVFMFYVERHKSCLTSCSHDIFHHQNHHQCVCVCVVIEGTRRGGLRAGQSELGSAISLSLLGLLLLDACLLPSLSAPPPPSPAWDNCLHWALHPFRSPESTILPSLEGYHNPTPCNPLKWFGPMPKLVFPK